MKKDYFILAISNLRHRGLRSWLTILGILIGITAVVSLISLEDGLKMAVNSQFGISSTEVLTVQAGGLSNYGPPGTGVINPLTAEDVEAIEKLSNVKIAIARNIESLKLEFNKKIVISLATNIPEEKEKREYVYQIIDISTLSGKLLETDPKKVVLGYGFSAADKNGFNKAIKAGDRITINGQSYEVSGILNKKGSFILDNIVLMLSSELKDLADYGDRVDIIAVVAKDKDSLNALKEEIEKLLRNRRNVKIGQEDFEVSTPDAALETVNQILFGVQIFIVMIASISIIVGAVGISNTMVTSVLERKKEIGTMKAVGAKNSDIFYQFTIEAGILGLIGGLLGAALGTAVGYFGTAAINNFIGSQMSPNINFMLIFLALLGSFIIGAVSGILPALRAAKLNPVEALRG
ncbi:MAG: ABC transporter permease [Nanoarchaeota archaeon]